MEIEQDSDDCSFKELQSFVSPSHCAVEHCFDRFMFFLKWKIVKTLWLLRPIWMKWSRLFDCIDLKRRLQFEVKVKIDCTFMNNIEIKWHITEDSRTAFSLTLSFSTHRKLFAKTTLTTRRSIERTGLPLLESSGKSFGMISARVWTFIFGAYLLQ